MVGVEGSDDRRHRRALETGDLIDTQCRARRGRQRQRLHDRAAAFLQERDRHIRRQVVRIAQQDVEIEERAGRAFGQVVLVSVASAPAVSIALTVMSFTPICSGMSNAVHGDVPLARPLPPRSFSQSILAIPVSSNAFPTNVISALRATYVG